MLEAEMRSSHSMPRGFRQRGIATVAVVVLLIVGVLFILAQTLGIIGTRSIDNVQDLDSTAALMLAESGLERARAVLSTASDSNTDATCTGIATGPGGTTTFSLGPGRFTYSTPNSTPTSPRSTPLTCDNSGATECSGCSVPVTGTVNSASRQLKLDFDYGSVFGVTGRGTTVTMVLRNKNLFPALGLFQMGFQRQDAGGNADGTICTGCGLQFNVESSSGSSSVGVMGIVAPVAAADSVQVITQTLSLSRDFVEVGGLFPSISASAAPTIVGKYWNDDNGGGAGQKTVGNNTNGANSYLGKTNNGVSSPTGACVTPAGAGTKQTCNNWCYGGDTLVFGFGARQSSFVDQLTRVEFNYTGTAPIDLQRLAHFPASDTPNPRSVYSEIWWAYNFPYPNFEATGAGAGAINYARAVRGTAGATVNLNSKLQNNDTTMTVDELNANSRICVGDTFTNASGTPTFTISAPAGCNTTTTYTFSPKISGGDISKTGLVVSSTNLQVLGSTGSTLNGGATNLPGVSILSGPSANAYTLSTPTMLTTTYVAQDGPSTTIIRVPTGSLLPVVDTVLAIYSKASGGSGTLAPGTKVTSVDSVLRTFTIDPPLAPGQTLAGITLCGGTCAFFNQVSGQPTDFRVTATAGTLQWGSGFICLSGVNKDLVKPITSTKTKPRTWQELVQ